MELECASWSVPRSKEEEPPPEMWNGAGSGKKRVGYSLPLHFCPKVRGKTVQVLVQGTAF